MFSCESDTKVPKCTFEGDNFDKNCVRSCEMANILKQTRSKVNLKLDRWRNYD